MGTFRTMPALPSLPDGAATRREAAQILGVSPKLVTNTRWQGQLKPVTTSDCTIGLFDRAQVEALAAVRASRRLEAEKRRDLQAEPSRHVLPPD